ncbi:aminotransferase [Sphingomonas oleivorans]|uniref:Cysteine desulfurase n=1 Tax=Sphingomonas oleivorans TaxID=1735121 RepID=A0A2T5FTG1_9SPHN|nr:cysteine desulfurase family protein [Sphingomonas oleivorans]PTQ07357.1 aminotransferase [Sphingomonas oleivorans]
MDAHGRSGAGARGMIYLDYQATTPLAPEARAAMLPFLTEKFGNPHSPHRMGREAAAAVEVAAARVSAALGQGHEAGRLIFTSGATESANWAIQGALRGRRGRIVTIATEHACVLDTARAVAAWGGELIILPVDAEGLVDLEAAAAAIDGDTALVAAMLVNNEIGVIQPVEALAALAHEAGALFFCDAVQAYGRVPVPLDACDMVAISAHKVHGPKGIGALWLRDGIDLPPLLFGGGQQAGLRSGTLSPALCAGFGAAAALLAERGQADAAHVAALWTRGWELLGEGWTLNGSPDRRYRGNLNIWREGVDAARLISELRDIVFSAGSACASGSGRLSHVLSALGLSDSAARSSIRLGFGRYTTMDELEQGLGAIAKAAARQREWA